MECGSRWRGKQHVHHTTAHRRIIPISHCCSLDDVRRTRFVHLSHQCWKHTVHQDASFWHSRYLTWNFELRSARPSRLVLRMSHPFVLPEMSCIVSGVVSQNELRQSSVMQRLWTGLMPSVIRSAPRNKKRTFQVATTLPRFIGLGYLPQRDDCAAVFQFRSRGDRHGVQCHDSSSRSGNLHLCCLSRPQTSNVVMQGNDISLFEITTHHSSKHTLNAAKKMQSEFSGDNFLFLCLHPPDSRVRHDQWSAGIYTRQHGSNKDQARRWANVQCLGIVSHTILFFTRPLCDVILHFRCKTDLR